MEKKLDLSKSVYDLVQEYPEVIDIMKGLGDAPFRWQNYDYP